jgi:hypothetical protein
MVLDDEAHYRLSSAPILGIMLDAAFSPRSGRSV